MREKTYFRLWGESCVCRGADTSQLVWWGDAGRPTLSGFKSCSYHLPGLWLGAPIPYLKKEEQSLFKMHTSWVVLWSSVCCFYASMLIRLLPLKVTQKLTLKPESEGSPQHGRPGARLASGPTVSSEHYNSSARWLTIASPYTISGRKSFHWPWLVIMSISAPLLRSILIHIRCFSCCRPGFHGLLESWENHMAWKCACNYSEGDCDWLPKAVVTKHY